MAEELKAKILKETPEERQARTQEIAEKLKQAGVDVAEVLMRFRLEDPDLVKQIYGDIIEGEEKEEEDTDIFKPQSIQKLLAKGETSLSEVFGMVVLSDWLERRDERRRNPGNNPEVQALQAKIDQLTNQLTELRRKWEKEEEEAARKRELDILRGEISSLRATIEELRRQPPPQPPKHPEEESPYVKELKSRLEETLKKVASLEDVIRAKEIQGMKADLLNQFKADLEPIKSELLRMQGRIEEAGASKGSMDRALARELKMLSIIDQRLAGIEAKLPTATEAAEIIRQIQPPQVRTTPPRTEEEKAAAYREAIRKLEEEAQKEKAEAKEAPEPKPEAKKTNKPKTT